MRNSTITRDFYYFAMMAITLGFGSITHAESNVVNPETFIRAETDRMFHDLSKQAGGINKFFHFRRLTPLDKQTVIRMNRDTLYSMAVVDTLGGATITVPEIPEGRYASVYLVDNDHYVPFVIYQPGIHKLPTSTRYLGVGVRIQIFDPMDKSELKLVSALQDKFIIKANSATALAPLKWDKTSLDKLRKQYEKESSKYSSWKGMQGPRGKVDEKTRHIAAAAAWGLFPEWDAAYLNYSGGRDDKVCHSATYQVPDNDAFWSITIYGSDGFIKHENSIINAANVKLNDDGTFSVYYGSLEVCGEKPNRLDVPEGWNFLMRVYRPGKSVLDERYTLPTVVALAEGVGKATAGSDKIIVTEGNFTIAETDLYMSRHVKDHPVNTIRHSRNPSSKDEQFVIRENQDVLYSHAVVDISKGATFTNPDWDVYSSIQVLDENQYTIAVIYSGETVAISPAMVALGNHVFLNIRTGLRSLDDKGLAEAHRHQDGYVIDAKSSMPYVAKGFDLASLDAVRAKLITHMTDVDVKPWLAFGTADEIDPKSFLVASAAGWAGLPVQHATYIASIQPAGEAKSGKCSSLTLPVPPLQFDKGGFFSVTTYAADGWIATDNFALNNRQATPDKDGSYTFHFNCEGEINNMQVQHDWTMMIRLYIPESLDKILKYIKTVEERASVAPK